MTHHEILHAKPTIRTASTRQLARHIGDLCNRDKKTAQAIAEIRNGGDRLLLAFVRRTQAGDADAALIAIWALMPRLCAAIIDRLPLPLWRAAVDDYISLAYLVVSDLDTTQPSSHLADKIIARTRRRHERHVRVHQPVPYVPSVLDALGPTNDDVERQALARIELTEVVAAAQRGVVTANGWRTILSTRFDWQPGVPTTARDRQVAARAQQRLADWRVEAA